MQRIISREKKCLYGKEDISFGKFYKVATNTNKRLLKDVFDIIFYRTHVTIIESWPDCVEDYCLDILGWSRKKYRDAFSNDERKNLTDLIESFECDVSLFNKLIIKIFEDVNLPTTFYSALREVKNSRNRVCHDQLDFTEESLQSNMEDMKLTFQKLLKEVEITFDVDVSGLEKKYLAEVDEIMAAPITGEGSSYFEKMEKFREDLMGKFTVHGRTELVAFYSKLKVLNPFTWLRDDKFSALQVDKIFTPLHISDRNILVDVESLLVIKPIDEDTLEEKDILPSVLILTGIAGCGKSSLCRYLLYDWKTRLGLIANMRAVDILIFIEMRNVTTNSLLTYLQQTVLKETCSHFEAKDILPTLQKLNVLYVVDGMDEATADGRKLLNEIFSLHSSARVLLTTRPEFTSSINWSVVNHHLTSKKFQIHGFSDKGIAKFTSKVLSCFESDEAVQKQQEKECYQFLMTTGRGLGDHLKIPLTLALLIILWKDDTFSTTNITSVTRLYSEIFKMCSMKMMSRVRKNTSSTCLDLENFIDEWLLQLGKVAYDMVKKDQYIITSERRKTLTSLCKKYCVDVIQVLSAFLICEVHEGIRGIQHSFSFIHKSQMEYLAGYYHSVMLSREFKMESSPSVSNGGGRLRWLLVFDDPTAASFQEIREMKKMSNVYLFTVGNLCMQKEILHELVKNVANHVVSNAGIATKIPMLWSLVQESDCHPSVCNIVGISISSKFIWKPEVEELCNPNDPTLRLFKHTHFTPKGLMIRIVDSTKSTTVIGDNERPEVKPYINLIPILQSVAQKPEIDVVLRVDQHFYNWGTKETTDTLLGALTPNGNLTGFMGHLSAHGVKAFSSLNEVQTVYLRISDTEALHALRESIHSLNRKLYLELTLRVDITPDTPVTSFPQFDNIPPFSVVLQNISDETAQWASDVLATLNSFYVDIELLSSSLTLTGGMKFLDELSSKGVRVKEEISFHSFHWLHTNELKDLKKYEMYKVNWW